MISVSFFSALLGGVLTFFAPCTLPLIPAYIAFIGSAHTEGRGRKKLFANAVMFVIGFSLVFLLYGLASGALGKYLVLYRKEIAQIGGVAVVFFGLAMLGALRLPKFLSPGMGKLPHFVRRGTPLGSFLLGFFFAFGWSPCLGPILGTILVLAGESGTALFGGMLLLTYALGFAIPFLLVAFLYGSAFHYVSHLERYLPYITRAGGVLMLLIGFLLIVGEFGMLNAWITGAFGGFGYDTLMEYM